MVEKINERENKDLTELRRVDLVEAFNKALEEHPLETMFQYYVRNAKLGKEEIDRMDKQMSHFLLPGDSVYLTYSFKGSEKDLNRLGKIFGGERVEDETIYLIENNKSIITEDNKTIIGDALRYYLRYDKRTHTFEIGVVVYPKSQDDKVIEIMRENLKAIQKILES